MSSLTALERRKLEKLFGMDGGYVLNFNDRTFAEFFIDFGIEIDSSQYRVGGDSKAKRIRTFWDIASDYSVGAVLKSLINYGEAEGCFEGRPKELKAACLEIAGRLAAVQSVSEIDALTEISDKRDFEVIATEVREAIEKNQPEVALDRLHTLVIKLIRAACELRGIETGRDKALHSIFGEYVKALAKAGHIESQMTERILKSSISVLESFNEVRNNKSLAHDNPILNYEESLLICNHVTASVRFIRAIESRPKTDVSQS